MITILQFACAVMVMHGLHYLFDFKVQTEWQANNKSHDNWALTSHVLTYTSGLGVMSVILLYSQGKELSICAGWTVVNGVVHWCVDWCTSRITSSNWKRGRIRAVFLTVGADQLIHHMCLLWSFYIAVKP